MVNEYAKVDALIYSVYLQIEFKSWFAQTGQGYQAHMVSWVGLELHELANMTVTTLW